MLSAHRLVLDHNDYRCKKAIKSLQKVLFLAIDIQRATPSFADGLGYSTLVGHMGDERIVLTHLWAVHYSAELVF